MKEYGVVWTETATDSIISIVSGFDVGSAAQAQKIADKIFESGNSLALFPLRGRIVPELINIRDANVRELFYKPWRIIYEVHSVNIEVLHVIDGRRQLDETLLKTLLERD